MTAVETIKRELSLVPHPEGGFYAETYKARERIPHRCLPARFKGERAFSTAIYFLLPTGSKSRLHRIQSDEVWHFYLGGPLEIVGIDGTGLSYNITMGSDILNGQKLQYVVPAGHWFGAAPLKGTEYSLVGCTVAPGFDFADFEMGEKENLLESYPQAREIIERFC